LSEIRQGRFEHTTERTKSEYKHETVANTAGRELELHLWLAGNNNQHSCDCIGRVAALPEARWRLEHMTEGDRSASVVSQHSCICIGGIVVSPGTVTDTIVVILSTDARWRLKK